MQKVLFKDSEHLWRDYEFQNSVRDFFEACNFGTMFYMPYIYIYIYIYVYIYIDIYNIYIDIWKQR